MLQFIHLESLICMLYFVISFIVSLYVTQMLHTNYFINHNLIYDSPYERGVFLCRIPAPDMCILSTIKLKEVFNQGKN